jgi:dienelactone hydrolase
MTPYFSATQFVWFEAGGVYAVANLRGGGEYGDAWHRGGQLEKKQNVFDDFFAAAEWLIENKYTSSKRLAISGGSNGGLLTGAAIVQRPELFRAVISAVPLLDMLRYQRFLMARFWVPEYGSAEDPKQFQFLRAYSPYHQVKAKTAYPAVLLTAGENDSRVHPLHARKMAAALQAATSSDPQKRPVLLWVNRDAGHGSGKPLTLRIRDRADSMCFLLWQLGVLEQAAAASERASATAPPTERRFTYMFRSQGSSPLEVVWKIVSADPGEIHYTVATSLNGSLLGEPIAAVWKVPAKGPGVELEGEPTQTVTVEGRAFTCRLVTTGEYTNWIHFRDGRPAFPPIIRQEKGGAVSMELIKIE